MVETRSASTALNKHKCLTQFFRWLVLDEEAIQRSPMQRVRPPITPEKLIPILTLDETRSLAACNTKSFVDLRDQAIIRLFYNTGGRLSEIANLHIDDVDLHGETVRFHGKGAKDPAYGSAPRPAARSAATSAPSRPSGSRPAPPVARRTRRPTPRRQRHQDPPPYPRHPRRRRPRPRPPLAPQLRPRMETRRRRHRRPHAAPRLELRRHAPPLRRQRRRRTRATDPGAAGGSPGRCTRAVSRRMRRCVRQRRRRRTAFRWSTAHMRLHRSRRRDRDLTARPGRDWQRLGNAVLTTNMTT